MEIPCEVEKIDTSLDMLTREQENIIYGCLLGDAQVEKNGKSHRIRFEYAHEAELYIQWLAKKLSPYSLKILEVQVYDKRTKRNYKKYRFDTITDPLFSNYQPMFYSSSIGLKDRIPSNIKEILVTPLVLSVWTLDDGAKRTDCNAYRLHTERYTLTDIKKLQEALLENFGLDTTHHKHKNKNSQQSEEQGYLIAIGAKNGNADKFRAIVQNYVNSEMPNLQYKFFQPCND